MHNAVELSQVFTSNNRLFRIFPISNLLCYLAKWRWICYFVNLQSGDGYVDSDAKLNKIIKGIKEALAQDY